MEPAGVRWRFTATILGSLAMHVIYEIRFSGTNKRYVGSAVDFAGRTRGHILHLAKGTHVNAHLLNAYRKYGEDGMHFVCVEEVANKEDLLAREQHHIDSYPWDSLYNICPTAGSQLGAIHSAETRAKMSASRTGKRASAATRAKMSASHKGKSHSAETRAKISASLKKRNSTKRKESEQQ